MTTYTLRHQGQADVLAAEWRPVLGWEEFYEVSSTGQVRRHEFISTCGGGARVTIPAGPVRAWVATNGYINVNLQRNGRKRVAGVHVLIAEAFLGPRPGKWYDARHLDGNRQNNVLANIAWGTRAENALDTIRHGRHHKVEQTHCKHGHPFDEDNTLWRYRPGHGTGLSRECLACREARNTRRRKSTRAKHPLTSATDPTP